MKDLLEALGIGGQTAVIGMGIVFGVLIILFIVLYLFKIIFYRQAIEEAAPKELIEPDAMTEITDAVIPALSEGEAAFNEPAEPEEDEQLVAVITAAIAASLNTSTYKLNIKSIRRVGASRSAWNRAGLNETIGNRF